MREKTKNKKVIVAMSGGVDSSVTAALLKREGFEVAGIFLKLWPTFSKKRPRKVAEKLGIPFYVFDFSKEFKKKVVDYFLKEYKAGRTPNPCVVCNKEIKFELLFKKALTLDADYIATGHYARIKKFVNSQQIRYSLMIAKDKKKDQSYFLWKLNQKILKRTLFPVGDYTKEEVRKLAKKFKLPNYNTPESQEICFIQTTVNPVKSRKAGAKQFSGVNYFLKKNIKLRPGKIVDVQGKILGEHQGLWFYTIGQRKGIKLPGGPFYVLDKNLKKNALIVTQNENDLYKKELTVKNINWILGKQPKFPLKVMAKIRYRYNPASAVIQGNRVIFDKPQRAITSGQSVVFYKNQELLGGGIIL